jgi:multimeric flavodoxin WrbA
MAKELRETDDLGAARNYVIPDRTLTAAWNIVRENDAAAPTLVMQDLGNGTKGKARLFDGGKIHVVAQREAGTGDTVKSFGVIIDKEGKLAAPKDIHNAQADTLAYAAATTALVLGNEGYTASGEDLSGDAAKALKRGANIKPTTVDTGVWVRPYYVDMDGNAHYGDPEYFELADVTQRELQLRVPGWNGEGAVKRETKVVDDKEVSTGNIIAVDPKEVVDYDYMDNNLKKYNVGPVEEVLDGKLNRRVYYVAAVKNTLDKFTDPDDPTNSRVKVEPKRFGIILDKNGVLPANDGKTENAYATALEEMKVDDARFRTTTTSNASQHGENAYGANITPKDVFTGVWVRPYVDFGNDLIVYGEPVYFTSFNDYFAALYGVTFYDTITDTKNNTYKAITVNATGEAVATADKMAFYYLPKFELDQDMYKDAHGTWYNENELTYAEAGVVVDRTNSVENTDTLSLADVDKVNVVSGKRTKDVINSKVNNTHPGVYGATIKKTDSIVNVRPFIKIDDDLTLYGPVQSVTFEDAKKGVPTWEEAGA